MERSHQSSSLRSMNMIHQFIAMHLHRFLLGCLSFTLFLLADRDQPKDNSAADFPPHHSDLFAYSSSVTFSYHSVLPSAKTKCDMRALSSAPCQWWAPGGHQTTSPSLILLALPPWSQIQPAVKIHQHRNFCIFGFSTDLPEPLVTLINCPFSCLCQAVRAPGVKVTVEMTGLLLGSSVMYCSEMSRRTWPVNHWSGPDIVFFSPFSLRGTTLLSISDILSLNEVCCSVCPVTVRLSDSSRIGRN